MLPAAQVRAQQQSHPTAMGLLLLRSPLASSLSWADLSPLFGLAARISLLSAEQQPPCHPQWDSLQLSQQHHGAQTAAAAALPQGPWR